MTEEQQQPPERPDTDAAGGPRVADGAGGGASGGTGEGTESTWGPASEPPARTRIRRTRKNKVVGGVCGGLGRYFDLDPVIFRVPLVVLSIVGGLGLVFYGFAWLFIPADGESENEGRRLLSGRVESASLSAILVALVGCGLFLASLGGRSVPFSMLLVGTVAGAAFWSQHRRQAEAAGAEGAEVDPATAHAVADAPPETQAPPAPPSPSWWREPLTKEAGARKDGGGYLWGPADAEVPARSRRASPGFPGFPPPGPYAPRSGPPWTGVPGPVRPGAPVSCGSRGGSLGGLTFLLAALTAGICGAAFWTHTTVPTALTIALSGALAVFGLGLAISAFVGRVGFGTIVSVAFTAILLTGATALPKDISGDVRNVTWRPASVAKTGEHYHLGTGQAELDLRELDLRKGQTVRTSARVGGGQLKVVVPTDARVEVSSQIGAGATQFPERLGPDGSVTFDSSGGLRQRERKTLLPLDGSAARGTVVLKLSVGVGQTEIVRELPSGSGRTDSDRAGTAADAGARTGQEPAGPADPVDPVDSRESQREGDAR